jgi:hypothetical protein
MTPWIMLATIPLFVFKETTRNELIAAGYSLTGDFNFLERQTFQVLKR